MSISKILSFTVSWYSRYICWLSHLGSSSSYFSDRFHPFGTKTSTTCTYYSELLSCSPIHWFALCSRECWVINDDKRFTNFQADMIVLRLLRCVHAGFNDFLNKIKKWRNSAQSKASNSSKAPKENLTESKPYLIHSASSRTPSTSHKPIPKLVAKKSSPQKPWSCNGNDAGSRLLHHQDEAE